MPVVAGEYQRSPVTLSEPEVFPVPETVPVELKRTPVVCAVVLSAVP
jgi:hypothetical protein